MILGTIWFLGSNESHQSSSPVCYRLHPRSRPNLLVPQETQPTELRACHSPKEKLIRVRTPSGYAPRRNDANRYIDPLTNEPRFNSRSRRDAERTGAARRGRKGGPTRRAKGHPRGAEADGRGPYATGTPTVFMVMN